MNCGKICGVCGATLKTGLYAQSVASRTMGTQICSDASLKKQRTINVSGGHTVDVSKEEAKHIGYREVKSCFCRIRFR